jgi:hypothetical protein
MLYASLATAVHLATPPLMPPFPPAFVVDGQAAYRKRAFSRLIDLFCFQEMMYAQHGLTGQNHVAYRQSVSIAAVACKAIISL